MNACPNRRDLEDLLEARLESPRQAVVYQHLERCQTCRAALDLLTAGAETLDQQDPPSATEMLSHPELARMLSRLRELPRRGESGEFAIGEDSRDMAAHESRLRDGACEIHFPGPPSNDAPLGRIGSYRVLARLGEGSSGLVFRALDERLGRSVALKVLRNELAATEAALARLDREARAVAALKHEHIVTLYQLGQEPGFPPYLVMELIEGEPLSDRLAREGALPPRDAARIVREAALALSAAHGAGLVHRDVKPSNILIENATQKAKLVDFGLARPAEAEAKVTRSGLIAGTPSYMSPEQISRPDELDGRSDVYSLGVVLYELLTGEVPFRGVVRMTLWQVLHEDPRPPARLNDAVPCDLETVCLKALAKEPSGRYATADLFADDLERWLEGRPVLARPLPWPARLGRWCARYPVVASLAGVVLLLLCCVATGSTAAAVWLKSARDSARAAQSEARRSAASASRQRDLLLDTLHKLVYDAQEQLDQDEVDIDEVQKLLLATAVEGLRRVARSADSGGQADRSSVAAHARLGATLLRLDQIEEAERHFVQAETLLAALQAATPDDVELLGLGLEIDWSRGESSYLLEEGPRPADYAARALQRCRDHVARRPQDDGARRLLAKACFQSAEAELFDDGAEGESGADSLSLYSESVDLYTALAAQQPADPTLAGELLQAQSGLGQALSLFGEPHEAHPHWRKVAELAAKLEDRFPEEPKFRYHLYLAYDGLAEAANEAGRVKEAEADYLKAIELSRGLSRTLPEYLGFDEDLADTCESLADLYAGEKEFEKALQYHLQRERVLERVSRRNPHDDQLPTELARAHVDLARVYFSMGNVEESRERARRALQILEPRTAERPRAWDDREQLVLAHLHLSDLARVKQVSDEESRQLKSAQAQVERLFGMRHPEDLHYLEDSLEVTAAKIRTRLERLGESDNR